MEGDLLSGSGQYTLLLLAFASAAYIRHVPYKEVSAILSKTVNPQSHEEERRIDERYKSAAVQAIALDLMQLAFVMIGVLILGREIFWGSFFDGLILGMYFILSAVMLGYHLMVNSLGITKSIARLEEIKHDEAHPRRREQIDTGRGHTV